MAEDKDKELTVDDLEDELPPEESDDDEDEEEEEEEVHSNNSDDPEWGATIVVNNTTYAVSLFWQPLQDTNDPYPEVRETVENVMEGADLFCLRSGTSPQYGIGNSSEGHKAGMPSAAAAVAEVFQDKSSSVAVFEVDEGWWFIAVRNDLILSEEDILYLNEEDAKRAFFAMMAVPDWGRKIAPASWEIEGTEEVDLWKILKNPGMSKLMHISKGGPKTKIIAIGAGLLVLYIGYKLLSGIFFPAKKPVVRPLTPLPFTKEEEPPPQQEEVIVHPWEHLVVTEALLNRCQAAAMQMKTIFVPGWEMGVISCSASGLSTTWTMKWGNLGFLKHAFEEYNINGLDYVVDESGKTAVTSLAIGDIPVRSQAPKMRLHEIREELTNIFQSINMPISLKEDQRAAPMTDANGLAASQNAPRPRVYLKIAFSFSSELPMEDWLSLFNKFPALEILNLRLNPQNNIWTYEGQIYEPSI